jgi:hypothetical protein
MYSSAQLEMMIYWTCIILEQPQMLRSLPLSLSLSLSLALCLSLLSLSLSLTHSLTVRLTHSLTLSPLLRSGEFVYKIDDSTASVVLQSIFRIIIYRSE